MKWLFAFGVFLSLVTNQLLLANADSERTGIRIRLSEDAGTLDWNLGEINQEIIALIHGGLFTSNREGDPEPYAVKSWKAEKNRYVFQLKEDMRWSDGSPLCAEDFVRSWQRLQSKTIASPYAHYAAVLRSYRAESCHTLTVETTRFAPELPALLSHYVFFPLAANQDLSGTTVIGSYRIKKWRKDQSVLLEPNPFSIKQRDVDEIEFVFIPEDATAIALFEKKELDIVFHVPQLMRKAFQDQLLVMPQFTNYFLAFGREGSAAKNESLRQAMRAALPTNEIPQWLGNEVRPLERRFLPYKLQTKQPKFPQVFSRRNKSWLNHDLKLFIYNKSSHKQLAEWAQAKWQKNLGVKIPIEVREEKVYWSELPKKSAPIFLNGITAPYPHPRAFLQDFLSDSSANWTGFRNKKFDSLLAQGKFAQAEKLLWDSAWVIPLYERGQVILANAKWRGKIWVNPLGRLLLGRTSGARASSAF